MFDNDGFTILNKKIGDKTQSIWLLSQREKGDKNGGTIHIPSEGASNQSALSDVQILEVANLVARVEQAYNTVHRKTLCPVNMEWAFSKGRLYLLQARPVTTHVPLFPEMLTPRGADKRNLYLDVIVMT